MRVKAPERTAPPPHANVAAPVGVHLARRSRAGRGGGAHRLTLSGLTRTYGPLKAVDDVSLDVASGEFLTLLGPSGSGKTTLLMMIAGFVDPSAGDVLVDGRPVTGLAPERRNFGMVFQGYALFPHMSVADNVAYPLKVRGVPRAEIAARVEGALDMVRLKGFGGRMPRQLSGGQQQRVAIARALVFEPAVLLLDEPLGALDRQLRAEVQAELKALHAELGTTFVCVTHDQDEALSMSDRVAVLDRGRVVQAGAPHELYERPRTRFVAEFLGRSNCIEGRALGRAGDGSWLVAGRNPGAAAITHQGPVPDGWAEGRPVLLSLRPEKLAVERDEPVGPANRAGGRVTDTAYLGATLHVTVETAAFGRLVATCFAWHAAADLAPGAAVWVSWPPRATVALEDEPPARQHRPPRRLSHPTTKGERLCSDHASTPTSPRSRPSATPGANWTGAAY
jgi:putative spermidine/putrescine transport system ATP-binding protein